MKSSLRNGFLLALAAFVNIPPVFSQTVDDIVYQWVDYHDGEISVAFDQAPVGLALNVLHARAGIRIVLPASAQSRLLNLRLNRLPLEPAVRSLISSIGFKNFALMYDDEGRPSTAFVVGTVEDQTNITANSTPAPERSATVQPLTGEERDKIQKDLERWTDLKKEERGRIEDRLKALPASEERDQLVKEYGRQILEIKK